MSEFIADAQVRILPNTTGFRAKLQEDINRAIAQAQINPVQIPIILGGGLSAIAAQTGALQTTQATAAKSALGLADATQLENSAFGRQAVLLPIVTRETQQKAGADLTAAGAAKSHAIAQGQVGKAAVASTAGMLGLRGAVLTAGTAFIAATVGFQALGKAVGSTIDFTRELAVFRVTAGATADEMNRVAKEARDLGRDITLPGVAANDAAKTLTELSKAGLSVQESLDAARGTLQLATAAEIDNAAAAELVANSLNAFQLSGTEAVRIADLLAGAANASQGSIADMGLALKQVASVARLVGLNVQDTVTLLTELSRAGLSSSDAGTSLRTTLLRLVGDFPKVSAEVARLGLKLRDVNGAIRTEFFSELGDKLRKMTPAARQATVALLGGSDAIRAIGILSRSTTQDFANLEAQITQAGIAQDVAAAQTTGLGGDVEAAKNQFADLGLTVGKVASGPLSLLVRTAGAAAGAINDLNSRVEESTGGGGFFKQFGLFINDFAGSFARLNFQFQQGVRTSQGFATSLTVLDGIGKNVRDSFNEAADAIARVADELRAKQGVPKDSGLNVQQTLNRLTGFDTQETAARIRGDSNALLDVLQSEQDFLLEQLDRRFVKNRPALFRKLQDALLGVTNDIASIGTKAAADAKSAATKAAQAANKADAALLQTLSNRRDDAARKAQTAGTRQGLADDIKEQNHIQALIKQQIATVRNRIKGEEARKAAIRELRIALITSRAEEEKLRQEQKQQAKDAATEILDIRIQIAETKGQAKLEAQLLNAKITRLKAKIKAAKGDRLLQAQLRLELAQTQKQLEDLKKQQAKNDNLSKELFFSFLQTQQGFAANLLGNLIPGFATAGLVGGSQAAAAPGLRQVAGGFEQPRGAVESSAALAAGRDRGVRPVQVDTTNHLLRQILRSLQNLNGRASHPEARHQRQVANAALDTIGGGA